MNTLAITIAIFTGFCLGFVFAIFFMVDKRERKIRKEIKENYDSQITIGEDGIMREIL